MPQAIAEYQRIASIIRGDDTASRRALAADPSTPPEALFYLADDADVAVRRAVAGNPSTPPQADAKLARDADVSVRCALARKAVGDGLDDTARRNLWRMGFTILETLARDQAVRVRKMLTDVFAGSADAPRDIVVGLARDREETVASPVLRASPVLTDDDVIDILADDPPDWAQEAIAGRAVVSARVTGALAGRGSPQAVARMLANEGAEIEDAVMEDLADRSGDIGAWQRPMAERPTLGDGVLLRLARVVAAPLLGLLRGRKEYSGALARRMEAEMAARPDGGAAPDSVAADGRSDGESAAAAKARRLHQARKLSNSVLAVALDNGETDFLVVALALRAGLPAARVRRMIMAKSGRTMMALAWRAGLSARFGLDLQRDISRVPPAALLYARDGLEFPLTIAEMKAQLAIFE
ncbi:MAG: DUF2336 domain-containing protein [Alphaproteobacteria bacterium]|nr:DUF2336 domain-containing protein [Alphaproteobacteria bacterium]